MGIKNNGPAADLPSWVRLMDEQNGWAAFEAEVRAFAEKFELPFSKALLHILFDVLEDPDGKKN